MNSFLKQVFRIEKNNASVTYGDYQSEKQTMPLKSRIVWLDICKGIAIILMILGHISNSPFYVKMVIFSFHMPLFMIVNGYLIHNYDIKKTFIKSAKSLLKPYIIVCLLQGVFSALRETNIESAGQALFKSLNDMIVGMSFSSTLFTKYSSVCVIWFVCCLFLARNIYVIIRFVFRNAPRIVQDIVIFITALTGVYIGKKIGFLPWSLDVAMASVVFIAFGDFLRTHNFNNLQKVLMTVTAFVCWIFLLYKEAWIELAVRRYSYTVLCFICAISGSIVIIVASKGIKRIPLLSAFLAWAGKNSIVILAVHCLELRFLKWDKWIYTPLDISLPWFLEFLVHCLFILAVTYAFVNIKKAIAYLNKKLSEKHYVQPNSKRLDWVDVAKGICIISIIIGHLGISWINKIVYVYHLPVFYIIAGYFFKKTDIPVFLKKKSKRLLLPYWITSAVICVLSVIKASINGTSRIAVLSKWIDAALYGAGNNFETPFRINGIGAIWFLWAMFFALMILNLFAEKKYYQLVIATIALIGWLSYDKTGLWLPLSIQAGMLAGVYLLIGYEIRKYNYSLEHIGTIPFATMFLITALGIQYFKGVWLVRAYYGNGLLDFFVTVAASFIIFAYSNHICSVNECVKRIFAFFGRNSLIILCAHIVDLNVLPLYQWSMTLGNIFGLNENFKYLFIILIRIIYVAIIAAAFELIKHIYINRKTRPTPLTGNLSIIS